MSYNPDFVQYIIDQTSDAGAIATRKMMGDYCLYYDGIIIGLICDNCLYIKPTETTKTLLREVILRPPYDGAKDYFYITDVDSMDYLTEIIRTTMANLPSIKSKKK